MLIITQYSVEHTLTVAIVWFASELTHRPVHMFDRVPHKTSSYPVVHRGIKCYWNPASNQPPTQLIDLLIKKRPYVSIHKLWSKRPIFEHDQQWKTSFLCTATTELPHSWAGTLCLVEIGASTVRQWANKKTWTLACSFKKYIWWIVWRCVCSFSGSFRQLYNWHKYTDI